MAEHKRHGVSNYDFLDCSRLVQHLVQANKEENIKLHITGPLWEESLIHRPNQSLRNLPHTSHKNTPFFSRVHFTNMDNFNPSMDK